MRIHRHQKVGLNQPNQITSKEGEHTVDFQKIGKQMNTQLKKELKGKPRIQGGVHRAYQHSNGFDGFHLVLRYIPSKKEADRRVLNNRTQKSYIQKLSMSEIGTLGIIAQAVAEHFPDFNIEVEVALTKEGEFTYALTPR